jgi:hypothetical protein
MKLVKCTGDDRFSLRCMTCGVWRLFNELWADLDGPAFLAYYCHRCKPDNFEVRR